MDCDSSTSLGPGFRFHPTDEELVSFYLKRKVSGKPFRFNPIAVVDIYRSEPWDLPCKSTLKSRDREWYFFNALDKKYSNGYRTNRATEKGYWKTTGKDRTICHNSRTVGMKKTLVYHNGRAPKGIRINWVMHEYRLADEELAKAGIDQGAFVLCRVFQKSFSGPKNGELYSAPLIDEEWEDNNVAAVPNEAAVVNEVVGWNNDFIQASQLEQNMVSVVTSESAPLLLNFYHGESSNCAGSCEGFREENFVISTDATSGPSNGQLLAVPEEYVLDAEPAKDEYVGEPISNESLLNFNCALADMYFDASDNRLFADGSFLETDDLANSIETEPTSSDMIQEYLRYFDAEDAFTQYPDFDICVMTGTRNSFNQEVMPVVENPVNQEIEAGKHGLDMHVNNGESSSKQSVGHAKFYSGIEHPFTEQASRMLGSIPAPPAFAEEFPSKDAILRLHSKLEFTNSVPVAARMMTIRNVTLRGDELGWTLSKNGDVSIILSHSLPQANINSVPVVSTSGLISGKTAFLVSHGWVLLMFFWAIGLLSRFNMV